METTPPPFGPAGQRSLAAIVFTDVVGFSARMHRDEEQTFALLQRDFGDMRRMCETHQGSVLKTTGDGLLCYFASAVKAVACALEMQRHFASLARMLPPEKMLQHRIGIHLGDVMVQDQDVMGDGVNIASRLQAEAEPGGICISQTVYDIVKNKLELRATFLGERDLKNISQAVPAYRLILEAAQGSGKKSAAASVPASATAARAAARSGARRWIRHEVIAAVIVVAVAAALTLYHQFRSRPVPPPAVHAAPAPTIPTPTVIAKPPAATARKGFAGRPANAAKTPAQEARRQWLESVRGPYLDHYDFVGLDARLAEAKGLPGGLNVTQIRNGVERMMEVKAWLLERLTDYGPDRPLLVPHFDGFGLSDYHVFGVPPASVAVIENGAPKSHPLAGLKPPMVGLLITALLKKEAKPAPNIVAGALAFSRFYGLPWMEKELRPLEQRFARAGAPGPRAQKPQPSQSQPTPVPAGQEPRPF